MQKYEQIHARADEIYRAELFQLAMINDTMGIMELGFSGGTEPVMLFKIEHKGRTGPGEPIHVAVPSLIAAILAGQIDAMVATRYNDMDRGQFNDVRDRIREMCETHPCAIQGCPDPAAHAEGAHDV